MPVHYVALALRWVPHIFLDNISTRRGISISIVLECWACFALQITATKLPRNLVLAELEFLTNCGLSSDVSHFKGCNLGTFSLHGIASSFQVHHWVCRDTLNTFGTHLLHSLCSFHIAIFFCLQALFLYRFV